MNYLEKAFDQALRSAASAKGMVETANFRGSDLQVLPLEQLEDLGPGEGGDADKAPIKLSFRKREVTLPVLTLEQGELADTVIFRGKTLYVLQYWPLEGRTDMLVGTGQTQLGGDD